MPRCRYRLVDVFTQNPLEGNALAVFLDASGLDGEIMQKIAREMNLSETTFILPATRGDCAAQVRIFTPFREMLFAGHPTVGTSLCFCRKASCPPRQTASFLKKKSGIAIRVEQGSRPLIWLTTPPISFGPEYDRALCAEILGLTKDDLLEIPPQQLSAGNPCVFIPLKNKEAVDRAETDLARCAKFERSSGVLCVFLFTATSEGAYSRMLAPEHGIVEDPATGSATGPLAAYMMKHRLVSSASGTRFISEQGTKMGRRSLLHVRINGRNGADGIEVGGYVTPVAEGAMTLP